MVSRKHRLERNLRTLHGWLGVLILPWVMVIGVAGLYLNHKDLVASVLPDAQGRELAAVQGWPEPQPATKAKTAAVARSIWPLAITEPVVETRFRGQDVFKVDTGFGNLLVVRASGHYWVETRYIRRFFDPRGHRLSTGIRWGGLLQGLHGGGWSDNRIGSWLVDIAALSLVVFGLSGLILFVGPRRRARKNQQARVIPSFPSSRSA